MTAHRLDRPLVIILTALLLVGCSPVATIAAPAPARTTFATRLRQLSAQPAIRRAARYRLTLRPDDPESLATAAQSSPESPQEVRAALAGDVDGVVIVAWLVSFGAMGAWTADDPRNPETVNIPVSAIPDLVANSPGELGVYRLPDRRHLMLVRPVVVGDHAVGAVGFVLTQAYDDPALAAAAKPIE
jgi:hypothetical protein